MYDKVVAKDLEPGQMIYLHGITARIVFKEQDPRRYGYVRVIAVPEPTHSWNGFSLSFKDDDIIERYG